MEGITAVYLAAGISSRFGGRIKALARVGPNNETLLEISMNQAKEAGVDNFVIIASDKTSEPLRQVFGSSFKGIPISYCLQKTPEYRKKPFGTSHALMSAKDFIDGLFIVLNSDDIYGAKTVRLVCDYLRSNKEAYCMPGYRLKNCIPKKGTVNRGIVTVKDNSILDRIIETFGISEKNIPAKLSGDELVSMNLFGLQPRFFPYLDDEFKAFLEACKDAPAEELFLPETISNFIKKNNLKMAVIPTDDIPIGLTNPQDEEIAREKLKIQAA